MEISLIHPRAIARRVLPQSAKNIIRSAGRCLLRYSYRYHVNHIPDRNYFPHILNSRRLLGEGVEIGTQRGLYSEIILSTWRGAKLYSIDPWREFPSESYVDVANTSQQEHDEYYQETVDRLNQFGSRSRILRKTSKEAIEIFKDGQLDFVYIDAQHHYEAVKDDIEMWFRKVKKGGVLAGHDYLDGHRPEGVFGVKSAVDEFARDDGLQLVISREQEWKSWFLFV